MAVILSQPQCVKPFISTAVIYRSHLAWLLTFIAERLCEIGVVSFHLIYWSRSTETTENLHVINVKPILKPVDERLISWCRSQNGSRFIMPIPWITWMKFGNIRSSFPTAAWVFCICMYNTSSVTCLKYFYNSNTINTTNQVAIIINQHME